MLDDHIAHARSQITALHALERELVALRGRCVLDIIVWPARPGYGDITPSRGRRS